MNLSTSQKQTHRKREETYRCQGGGGEIGMDWEFGISRYKLLLLKWISNEFLLYSTVNYIQSLGIDHDGSQYNKVYYTHTHTLLFCYTAEIGEIL